MTDIRARAKSFLSFSKDAKLPLEAIGAIAEYGWSLEEAALDAGGVDLVKVLMLGANKTCPPKLMDDMAASGHEATLRFLHRLGTVTCTTRALDAAAAAGHLNIVQFLHFNRTEGCTGNAVDEALKNEHLEIVRFLVKHRKEKWGVEVIKWAVEHDDTAMLEDILRNNPDFVTVHAKTLAYESGKLEMMKYMYEHGTNPRSATTLEKAASKGDLETVKFLVGKREGFLKSAMKEAVCNGHLDVVKYIHENAEDRHTAASRVVAMNYAALNGHVDILEYLHHHAPELGCTTFAMDSAAMRGHLKVVEFLDKNRTEGCTEKAMDQAAAAGHLDVVRYLHEHRTEGCTTMAMNYAAIRNHPEVVKYLHAHRTEGCTEKAFNDTAVQGLTGMVQLLLELVPDKCDLDNGIRLAKQRKFTETIAVIEAAKATRAAATPASAVAEGTDDKSMTETASTAP